MSLWLVVHESHLRIHNFYSFRPYLCPATGTAAGIATTTAAAAAGVGIGRLAGHRCLQDDLRVEGDLVGGVVRHCGRGRGLIVLRWFLADRGQGQLGGHSATAVTIAAVEANMSAVAMGRGGRTATCAPRQGTWGWLGGWRTEHIWVVTRYDLMEEGKIASMHAKMYEDVEVSKK